ncbi:MAG: hypothetical protein GY791_06225 [Alphaproteobacteria bacterium]|nr:hypothetical protein [Alphaproteobacteria bacterium]
MDLKLFALAIPIILTGCGTYSPPGNAEFEAGYYNGCMHGYALNSPYVANRDEGKYAASGDYRTGWNSGQNECADEAHSGSIAESWHP